MRLLIVKLSALGDVIQTLPALSLLRQELSSVAIDWVVEERNAELLIDHPYLQRTILFKREYFQRPKDLYFFLKSLRTEEYTMAIDFQGLLKSALIIFASRARYRIGFANHREGSPLFYNVKLKPYDPELHAVKRYLMLARKVILFLTFGRELEVEEVEEIPRSIPMPEIKPKIEFQRPFFLLIAGARWETKVWPYSHWETFLRYCEALRKDYDFYFIGSEKEHSLKEFAERMSQRFSGVQSLVGRLNLRELVYVMKKSRAIITVDTGTMHLASLLNKPILALFGPTSAGRTGPWSDVFITLEAGLPCQPCFKRYCKSKGCMLSLDPKKVVNALEDLSQLQGLH
ncbi:MAG: glycosyltransferase family 9 protein [Caldimicrobium sp.]|nr:glycosyltransferase family 9 protein [Caldimicrobium sp.]MCX7613888.1 glycosyltransferase family 9 protein [Caldimicrobium sp.]MDW8183438.1 glycosyltransferase family 9 protein [Caldimicrobium sp.]